MGTRRCGLLDVKDVELGQLPMVTETRERSSPVDTAGQLRHWRERDTCNVDSRQLGNKTCCYIYVFIVCSVVLWIIPSPTHNEYMAFGYLSVLHSEVEFLGSC